MRRPGLRTRVMAGFAAGAFVLSALMAFSSYEFTRTSLLSGRERSAIRATYADANVVAGGLATGRPDVVEVLRALNTGTNRRPLVRQGVEWFGRGADLGLTKAIPVALLEMVEAGQSGIQRVRTEVGNVLVIGIPLSSSTSFYVVDSLQELEGTLRTLAIVLVLVAGATTAAGAAVGWYATRRVLRPLVSVTEAARGIAAGDFTTRLDPAVEPELERLSSSFNDMVDQLSLRLQQDRRFAADVSHELRSPLQTLSAAASVLEKRREYMDERSAIAAKLISDEVARFEDLVTDLLELSRSDQPPDRTPVDVASLARKVCSVRGYSAELVTLGPDVDPVWHVDRRRFEQMLVNLLDNADRYGGGTVAIRLGQEPGLTYLEVDDEGPGVSPDDRDTIFDRFVRGSAARARGDTDGLGLGLALVRHNATAHGGRAFVTARPGGGARFRLEFPAPTR